MVYYPPVENYECMKAWSPSNNDGTFKITHDFSKVELRILLSLETELFLCSKKAIYKKKLYSRIFRYFACSGKEEKKVGLLWFCRVRSISTVTCYSWSVNSYEEFRVVNSGTGVTDRVILPTGRYKVRREWEWSAVAQRMGGQRRQREWREVLQFGSTARGHRVETSPGRVHRTTQACSKEAHD